jgi:hypothetical protein
MTSKVVETRRKNIKKIIDRAALFKPVKFIFAMVFFAFVLVMIPIVLLLAPFVLAWDLTNIFLDSRTSKAINPEKHDYEPFVHSRWNNISKDYTSDDDEFNYWIQRMEEE